METQNLGIDIGRGYVKAYSEYEGSTKECLFKSIIGLGRSMDTKEYINPIHIEYNKINYFIGELAEKEGYNSIQNLRDDKTTETVDVLIAAVLSQIAISEKVKIVLGVPNKLFNKKTMNEIKEFYKGKIYNVKDKINGSYKKVSIVDVIIFREGDASLLFHTKDRDRITKDIGMVTMGFRTCEFSYFDENMRFNDKLSKTKELGNKNALEFVQKRLSENNVMRELSEIDSSDKYDDLKEMAYNILRENLENEIESTWIHSDKEMDIFISGGTPLNFKKLSYELIDNPQMAVAKGLFLVGEELL